MLIGEIKREWRGVRGEDAEGIVTRCMCAPWVQTEISSHLNRERVEELLVHMKLKFFKDDP